jgi:hypothetical protein
VSEGEKKGEQGELREEGKKEGRRELTHHSNV